MRENTVGLLGARRGARTLLASTTLMALLACGGARPPGDPLLTGRAGELAWRVWLTPDPPQQKGNVLWVELLGPDGAALADGDVALEWRMPAMGSMPEMKGAADVSRASKGLFRVAFDFPMRGTWSLALRLTAPRGKATAEYAATVGVAGLKDLGAGPGATSTAAQGGRGPRGDDNANAAVRMDGARRQAIGVTTARVVRGTLVVPVRAVGRVAFDETRLTDVTARFPGYIRTLYADRAGQSVRRGQPLCALDGPELFAAQQEYLIALASQRAARTTSAPERADDLVEAARQKLTLWGFTSSEIDRIAGGGKPLAEVTIASPISGVLVEKDVVAGAAVTAGMRILRLGGLDTVWIEAEVTESELPSIRVGDAARVSFPFAPERDLLGRVAFVYPALDPANRAGKLRVELANPSLELKPEMLADVTLTRALDDRLTVPADAVLDTGEHSYVFVDVGEDRLAPRRVVVGQRAGDRMEILSGLREGETVVASGNFLVAAEARLKVPFEEWR
jgi:Cu(I)/Ag(I) efflux system membrane fusion protein